MQSVTTTFCAELVRQGEEILRVREEGGYENALPLWHAFDQGVVGIRGELPPPIFDLIMQLEFLMEGDPTADVNEVHRALYLAKTFMHKRGAQSDL